LDIDLDAGTLEVVQTLQRVGGALRFVQPKIEDSARTIPLPPLCICALREHRRQQFTERANAGPNWKEHGLVFPTRIGTPMEPDNLRRSWGRIRTAAGSPAPASRHEAHLRLAADQRGLAVADEPTLHPPASRAKQQRGYVLPCRARLLT